MLLFKNATVWSQCHFQAHFDPYSLAPNPLEVPKLRSAWVYDGALSSSSSPSCSQWFLVPCGCHSTCAVQTHFPRRPTVRLVFLVMMIPIPWQFSSALGFKRYLLLLSRHLHVLASPCICNRFLDYLLQNRRLNFDTPKGS